MRFDTCNYLCASFGKFENRVAFWLCNDMVNSGDSFQSLWVVPLYGCKTFERKNQLVRIVDWDIRRIVYPHNVFGNSDTAELIFPFVWSSPDGRELHTHDPSVLRNSDRR